MRIVWTAVLAVLVLAGAVSAVRIQVHDAYIYEENLTDTSVDKQFSASLSDDWEKAYINIIEGPSFLLENNSCDIKDYWKACFNGTQFSHYDTTRPFGSYTYTIINRARIILFVDVAKVNITRSIDKTTIPLKDSAVVTTTFFNDLDRPASFVSFVDSFPGDVIVEGITGCERVYNNVTWSGTLNKGQTKTCTYTIRALNVSSFNTHAGISYFDGELTRQAQTPDIKITIPLDSLTVNISIGDGELKIGEETYINVTVYKDMSNATKVKMHTFTINIDPGLQIIDKPDELSDDLTYREDIAGEKSFFLRVKALKSGPKMIMGLARYTENSITKESVSTDALYVLEPQPISITVIKRGSNELEVLADNNGEYTFYNIKVVVDLDGGTSEKYFESIPPGFSKHILREQMPREYELTITLSQYTEYGEEFISEKSLGKGADGEVFFINSTEKDKIYAEDQYMPTSPTTPAAPSSGSGNLAYIIPAVVIGIFLLVVVIIFIKKKSSSNFI